MILSILRSIGSVIAGFLIAFVFVVAAEGYSYVFHPFPPGLDPYDMEACRAHVAKYPPAVLAVCTAIWALAPLSGSWLATRLGTARHPAHGYVLGALLFAWAGMNMAMLPYPIWFPIVNLLTFPLGTYFGTRMASAPAAKGAPAMAGSAK